MIGAIVDTGDLLAVVWQSLAAGIGVCFIFSLAIIGATRSADHRRDGAGGPALAYAVLAALAFAGVAAMVAGGIFTMTDK